MKYLKLLFLLGCMIQTAKMSYPQKSYHMQTKKFIPDNPQESYHMQAKKFISDNPRISKGKKSSQVQLINSIANQMEVIQADIIRLQQMIKSK